MEISKQDKIYIETLESAWIWSALLEDVGIMLFALVFGLTPLTVAICVCKIIGFKIGKEYVTLLIIEKRTGGGSRLKIPLYITLKMIDWTSRILLIGVIILWALPK